MDYYLSDILEKGFEIIQKNDVIVFNLDSLDGIDPGDVSNRIQHRAVQLGVELSTFEDFPDRVHFGVKRPVMKVVK